MNDSLLQAIRDRIRDATGTPCDGGQVRQVGGGCINETFVRDGTLRWFVKVNDAIHAAMFEAENDALKGIAATHTIRVPSPIATGIAASHSYLVLEMLDLQSGTPASWAAMGRALAELHRCSSPDSRFGWQCDNFIGATPQPNGWRVDWITFWREQRLGFQFKLAAEKGARFHGADQLLDGLDTLLDGHAPRPSLLHGDLWNGNAGFVENGVPVIFDPASYFGDRECDLAFTRLFGGFPPSFYVAYEAGWPLPSGWRERESLYNLYHVLNHWNLFGGSYRQQAQIMIDELVRRL